MKPPLTSKPRAGNPVFIHARVDDLGLSPAVFRVYGHVARRAGHGTAWSAVAEMARVCRLHPQTVRRALQELVTRGMITPEFRRGETTLYQLTPLSSWKSSETNGDPSQTNPAPSNAQGGAPKPMQDRHSETNVGEVTPIEMNPKKESSTHVTGALPDSEDDAVKTAEAMGIDAEFAREEYHRMVGVSWLDGCKRPVVSWEHYLKQRWLSRQRNRPTGSSTYRKSSARPPQPSRQFDSNDYTQPINDF